MLRVIFWILMAANAILFAFHQDLLGSSSSQTKREPERLQRQLNPEQVKLLPANAVNTPAQPEPPKEAAKLVECIEIGNFPVGEIKRIEDRLAALNLGQNQTRINIEEATSHMVFIPPQDGKEGADRKVAELQQRGVTNYFVMADSATHRWGISLGVFKSEHAARSQLADLERKGVKGVRIAPRGIATDSVLYRLRNLDGFQMDALDKIMVDFSRQKKRDCQE